jgi:hypothetical protein
VLCSWKLAQDLCEIGGEVVEVKLPRGGVLGNYNDVPASGYPTVQAQPLANKPLDPIPNDRVPYFLGDRDSEPSDELGITPFSCEREHVPSVQLRAVSLDLEVLGASPEPHLFRDAAGHGYFLAMVTEMRLRPFARRRRSTSRPPRVFLRARKPCVRFRLLLCG